MSTNTQTDKSRFIDAAAACISNGDRLLDDVEFLIYSEPPSTAFALALIAQEEFAKAFLLFLVSKDVIAWNSLTYRATRDHTCKQLVGFVMSYLSPDWDEEYRRSKEWMADHNEWQKLVSAYHSSTDRTEKDKIWARIKELGEKRDLIPNSVVDAIDILRYEIIGRWESSMWVWEEKPVYDKTAKSLGKGKLDREKQDAVYVRLGRNGQVAKTPAHVKREEVKAAIDVAKRLRSLADSLVSGSVGSIEYEKIESAFKTRFASLSKATTQ
jgi:AbiV family abortive infection protein